VKTAAAANRFWPALAAVMLGGAYATTCLSARLGLPSSAGLLFEGRWSAPDWSAFPWLDCAGMLLFMLGIPLLADRDDGGIRFRAGHRSLLCTGIGIAAALAALSLRPTLGHRVSEGPAGVFLTYWFIVALTEEAAFRGVIQHRLTRRCSMFVALPVTVALFVLWHGWPASGTALLLRVAAGAVLGLLFWAGRSLLPAVVCHALLNLVLAF
jgi:membrane protease YdiL (CAAX protease family)